MNFLYSVLFVILSLAHYFLSKMVELIDRGVRKLRNKLLKY